VELKKASSQLGGRSSQSVAIAFMAEKSTFTRSYTPSLALVTDLNYVVNSRVYDAVDKLWCVQVECF